MSAHRAAYWVDQAYRALAVADVDAAARAADRARDANRHAPPVLLLTGHMLVLLGRLDEGLTVLRQAQRAYEERALPVPAQLYASAGMALLKQFRHDAARQAFLAALEANPDTPEPYIGLGTLEHDRGNVLAAADWFGEAARRFPANTAVRWGRAFHRLRQGDWPAAWLDYEMRLTAPDWVARWGQHHDAPTWDGQPIPGQTLLIYHEQGQGDTLMLSRYLPWARAISQCAALYLRVPPAMVGLLHKGADWVGDKAPPTPPDFLLPITSLPYLHGTTLDTVPPALELAA